MNVNQPVVSVLVAAYNAASTLPRCIDSLCSQSLADIEILCVDDCSTDDTLKYLRSRAASDSRIHVMQTNANSGQAVARNMALAQARGTFVAMLDADDWMSEDCLQSAVDVFAKYPQTDCVVLRLMQHFEADGSEVDYGLPAALDEGRALTGSEAFELCLNGWQLHGLYITRTELHQRIPFDTSCRLYSDDNTARLHYLESREVRACNGIYYYRKHDASMTMSFNIRRFDFMEANLSLLKALQSRGIAKPLMQRFQVQRWMTFIGCYRLFLLHRNELPNSALSGLRQRFANVFKTFSRRDIPLRSHLKPGYWLTCCMWMFDMQQRLYTWLKYNNHS